jgi:hypothetical protein
MARTYQDTFSAARQTLAQRIISHPLAHFLSPHDRERLQLVIDGTAKDTYTFLSLEFRKAGTNASLYVEAEPLLGWREERKDAEGNEWMEYGIRSKMNFPCHGSTEPGTVLARLAFYQEIALLAAEIQAEMASPIHKMIRGAQEIAQMAEKAAAEREAGTLQSYVRAKGHGLRAGGKSRYYDAPNELSMAGVKPGDHEVKLNEGAPNFRHFHVELAENGNVKIRRIA